MNLKQLRTLCEIVDHGLRITDAAAATFHSQPSVTRQVKELEHELGFNIFIRKKNKILATTPQGKSLISIARRMVNESENIYRMRNEIAEEKKGRLTIATTHTYARYALPRVIKQFTQNYPNVQLSLHQGNPTQCCELVAHGQADIAICSDTREPMENIIHIPCYKLNRSVITPAQHPLLKVKKLTLEMLARYPLITYGEAYNGRQMVDRTFMKHGLKPTVILSTFDADVSKVYVAMGLGIAIFATIVFDPAVDINLRRIDARHLFAPSSTNIVLYRHSFLRGYVYDFIQLFAPKLGRSTIEEALYRKISMTTPLSQLQEL